MIKRNCLVCNKEFVEYNGRQRRKKFCSQKCNIKHWNKDNPEKSKKATHKYRQQNLELCRERTRVNQRLLNNKNRFGGNRLRVLERDNNTCTKCGETNKLKLIVHHKNRNKKDNRLNNLITLCKRCHPYLHYFEDKMKEKLLAGRKLYEKN